MFQVKVTRQRVGDGDEPTVEHMTPEGTWTEDAEKALVCGFRWPPRIRDRMAIGRAEREIAGGLVELATMNSEIELRSDSVRQALVEGLGEAAAKSMLSDPGLTAQAVAEVLDDVMTGEELACLLELRTARAQVALLAEWPILFETGPAAWQDIGERELDVDTFRRLLLAWDHARAVAEGGLNVGNADSSTP